MSKKTDELLTELNNISNYNYMNEAFDIESIGDRLNNLKNYLLTSNGLRNATLSKDDLNLIKRARMTTIDGSIRVVTYPNIHSEQNYKINASVIFDFVMKRISEHAKTYSNSTSPKYFDATAVVHEGISYTLKYLTGKTPSKYITIDDFKREYQFTAFGSFRKVQLYPNIPRLSILAQRNPLIISFIENNLLYQQINSINTYSKKIENDFIKLLKNNNDLKYVLNSYMSCIERSIRALVNMYKIIRNTFIELQKEYFSVFKQIVKMDDMRSGRIYGECCTIMNDSIKTLNENISKIEQMNESSNMINNNYIDKNLCDKLNDMIKQKNEISFNIKNEIFKNLDLIAKINPLDNYVLLIPDGLAKNNIDKLNIKKYIDSIEYLLYSTDNIYDLVNKSSNILFSTCEKDINNFRKNITNFIIGNIDLKNINFDTLTKNVLNLIDYIDYIDNNYYKKINDNLNNIISQKSINFIKNILIGNMCIVDSIYYNILELLVYFIKLLKNNLRRI